jgi:putative tricarboxylic transport membrane protein
LKRLQTGHIVGGVCIALSLVVLHVSRSFPKATTGSNELTGPSFYPNLLSYALIICGILQVIAGFRSQEDGFSLEWKRFWHIFRQSGPINILCIIALVLFFILFMETLGFVLCCYFILFMLMWRFGVPVIRNLIYSGVFLSLVYLIFGKLFIIYLPSGVLDYVGF